MSLRSDGRRNISQKSIHSNELLIAPQGRPIPAGRRRPPRQATILHRQIPARRVAARHRQILHYYTRDRVRSGTCPARPDQGWPIGIILRAERASICLRWERLCGHPASRSGSVLEPPCRILCRCGGVCFIRSATRDRVPSHADFRRDLSAAAKPASSPANSPVLMLIHTRPHSRKSVPATHVSV